ncbi:MAG: pilus assembly protein PilZ [Alteromonadaceae bacterium]|nr:pilus assembly protein PilZ [Alteromonadaceae bacterium]|tara:strand:- start:2514 stop:3716 length:1203 start_codon:yes stop_codon:yes gene_type:complete
MKPLQTAPLDVVHEAIDERQHVRTRLPAHALLSVNGKHRSCEIIDISLGGMALSAKGIRPDESAGAVPLEVGTTTSSAIQLNLMHFELSVAARVKVVAVTEDVIRVAFEEIDKRKMDTLRYVISSYISGDVVNIDGVFNLMQRENYIKERKVKVDTSRSFLSRLRALAGSLLYLAVGLGIFAVIGYKLFLYFFQVAAVSGVVDGAPYVVNMPENGYVSFLVDTADLNGGFVRVESGQPIAAVSTQLMTSFNTPDDVLALTEITQQDLQTLYGKAFIETVINSPCDCYVYFTDSAMDRYVTKDKPLMHLLPVDRSLLVRASFPYDRLNELKNVESVSLSVFGDTAETSGEIVGSVINQETGMLDIIIRPTQAIDMQSYLKPVAVSVRTGTFFSHWATGTSE